MSPGSGSSRTTGWLAPRPGRLDLQFAEILRTRPGPGLHGVGERQREDLGERRAPVPAPPVGAPAAEGEQAAAALADEVAEHVELVLGEEPGLDAPEDDGVVFEQLLPGVREASGELVGSADAQPVELALRGPEQARDLESLIRLDGAPQELHLPAGLPLEVEDPRRAILDEQERALLVVPHDGLPGERGDAKPESPGARVVRRGERDNGRLFVVRAEADRLLGQDAPFVEHLEARRPAGESPGADPRPHLDERALDDARREIRADQFQVGLRARLPERHRVDAQSASPQVEQRLLEPLVRLASDRLRPVGQQDDASERQRCQLVHRAGERAGEVGARAGEREVPGRVDPSRVPGETEEAGDELLFEAGSQRIGVLVRVGRERRQQRVAPGLFAARDIADSHAGRVVEEDRDEVLLRHGERHHELGPKQAQRGERDRARPGRGQQDALDGPDPDAGGAIPEEEPHDRRDEDDAREIRRPRHEEVEISPGEGDRGASEEPLDRAGEHRSGPDLRERAHRRRGALSGSWRR